MSTLSSTSTRTDVLNAIADNASYIEDGSLTKCKAYITALTIFIDRFQFAESRQGGASLRYETSQFARRLRDAQEWLERHDISTGASASGGIRQFSVESFRS